MRKETGMGVYVKIILEYTWDIFTGILSKLFAGEFQILDTLLSEWIAWIEDAAKALGLPFIGDEF